MSYPVKAQEVFDGCLIHLWEQNSQSTAVWPQTGCMYYGTRGKKCAIGIFLEPQDYIPEMEWNTIGGLIKRKECPPVLCEWLKKHFNLLLELQEMHDEYEVFLENFRNYILNASDVIANKHKLIHFTPPELYTSIPIVPEMFGLIRKRNIDINDARASL